MRDRVRHPSAIDLPATVLHSQNFLCKTLISIFQREVTNKKRYLYLSNANFIEFLCEFFAIFICFSAFFMDDKKLEAKKREKVIFKENL